MIKTKPTWGYQWWNAEISPYKHTIVAYGTIIVALPSQIA